MDIEFSSHRLSNASKDYAEACRLFGLPVARKYIQRLAVLRAVDKFSELYGHRALKLHHLKGNRQNEYSITLTANYRLILEKIEEEKVKILDVEDYHGN